MTYHLNYTVICHADAIFTCMHDEVPSLNLVPK